MTKVLALDTALGACSAAVLVAEHVAAHEHRTMPRGHAEELAPMVQRVMNTANMPFAALQCVAVTIGPGTFTGQRVGLAFARALAAGLKIPVAGTTTLEAMAEQALRERPETPWAIVAADAKRGEVYLAAVNRNGKCTLAPRLIAVAEVCEAVLTAGREFGAEPALAGTGTELIHPLLTALGFNPVDSGVRQPDAIHVARAALRNPCSAKPLYLRPPDARLPTGAA